MTTWLSWAVTAVGALVLVVLVAVPRATGSTPYVVLTGSMEPAISPGDVVVVRPTPAEDLGVGSVVTYQLRSGRPEVVTHRVVGQGVADDGEVSLWTRGTRTTPPTVRSYARSRCVARSGTSCRGSAT